MHSSLSFSSSIVGIERDKIRYDKKPYSFNCKANAYSEFYLYIKFSLFSPAKLKENESAALFMVFQLLKGMLSIQDAGLFLGNISLHHLRLETDFHLTIIPQITHSLLKPESKLPGKELHRDYKGPTYQCSTPGRKRADEFCDLLVSREAIKALQQVWHRRY